jgi:ubiquinone/menaquinone biosynthesis C-methylase UbiE
MDIWECALSFMDSQTLLTAEELGIFNILEEIPSTAAEAAGKAGLPIHSTERLLNHLCAIGIILKNEDSKFTNTAGASKNLVKGKPEYIGDLFHHLRYELYPLWGNLKETIIEGKRQSHILKSEVGSSRGKDHHSLDRFFAGMYAITYRSAKQFAEQIKDFENVKSVADIGGGSGAFLIAFAEHFPLIKGTIVDLEYVQPFAEKYIENHQLEERIKFLSSDFFNKPLPENFDAYILSFVLHDWETESGSTILKKIYGAAHSGSLLLLSEYFLEESKTAPKHVVRSDLNMLVAARGMERTSTEYIRWLKEFGFETEAQYKDDINRRLIAARKI